MTPEEEALLEGLRADLNRLPGLSVVSIDQRRLVMPEANIDAVLEIEVQGRPVQVFVEAKAYGYPRDIRSAVESLSHLPHTSNSIPTYAMVIAPAISHGGRDTARRRNIGYWDKSGSLYMELPGGVYYVDRSPSEASDRSPLQSNERVLRNPYRGSSTQVLHVLLMEPDRVWHVQELAARAKVSLSTVHQVFTFLEQQLWVEKEGTGPRAVRLLRDPGALLDAWANAHSLEEYNFRRFHRWARSTAVLRREVVDALDRLRADYALTLASGAELVTPFLSNVAGLSILIPPTVDVEQLASAAELTPTDSGENVAFLVVPNQSPLLLRQKIDDVFVASPVQLYLDLSAWPMRGKEQAKHLRAELLPY